MSRPIVVSSIAIALVALTSGCGGVPPALVEYARADLPGRNAGAYSALTPELRGELVLKDAAAACSVALAQGAKETEDPACVCTHSSQTDWQQKCEPWFKPGGGSSSGSSTSSSATGGG